MKFKINKLYYQTVSSSEVEVVPQKRVFPYWNSGDSPTGAIVIPSRIDYNGATYNVVSIGESAFSHCVGIDSITIGSSVTSIEMGAFLNCSKLSPVTIGNSVISIGRRVFKNCSRLTVINIPNSVVSIGGGHVFYGCSGLSSINIPRSVVFIEDGAFENCSELTSIKVNKNNPIYSSKKGVLFDKNKKILIKYPLGRNGSYKMPDSVISIKDGAFYRCSNLTSITIDKSVKSIRNIAFSFCHKLTTIISKIPNPNQIELGNSVFYKVDKSECKLIIPKGSKTEYQAAPQWKDFNNIIEA